MSITSWRFYFVPKPDLIWGEGAGEGNRTEEVQDLRCLCFEARQGGGSRIQISEMARSSSEFERAQG